MRIAEPRRRGVLSFLAKPFSEKDFEQAVDRTGLPEGQHAHLRELLNHVWQGHAVDTHNAGLRLRGEVVEHAARALSFIPPSRTDAVVRYLLVNHRKRPRDSYIVLRQISQAAASGSEQAAAVLAEGLTLLAEVKPPRPAGEALRRVA